MNVCLLNDSFPPLIDGVANTVVNYAEILQEKGLADVTVATPAYPNVDYAGYPYRVIPYKSIDTSRVIDGYRAGNPLDLRDLELLVASKPDIIHTHCPAASALMARLIKSMTGAPLILTYHTKFDIDIARVFKSKVLREKAMEALVNNAEACDEVWVVSEGAGESLRSLGYSGDYIVMSNGVDFPKGRVDAVAVSEATKDYDLPEGVTVFLFVGRIIAYKGLPIILDALAQLEKDGMDYRMVFVGGGPDAKAMQERVEALGLQHCIFTGPISDRQVLRAWNTRANLFLFPSTFDTNGLVVREAAACGLASVLIRGSCAAEGISDGHNGYLIEESADSLAELLRTVGGNLEELSKVGQYAMDELYISWEDSVLAAYARYQILLANREAGMYDTKLHMREEQIRQHRQELIDRLNAVRAESREHRELLARKAPSCKMEDVIDTMRYDVETMLGNAINRIDERIEEIKERHERIAKWSAHAKQLPPKSCSDGAGEDTSSDDCHRE